MSQYQGQLTDRQLRQISKVVRQGNYLLQIVHSPDRAKVQREFKLLKAQSSALLRTKDRRGPA